MRRVWRRRLMLGSISAVALNIATAHAYGPPAYCLDQPWEGNHRAPPAAQILGPADHASTVSRPLVAWDANGPPDIIFRFRPGRVLTGPGRQQASHTMTHYRLAVYPIGQQTVSESALNFTISCRRQSFQLPPLRPLLERFQGHSLLWRLAACHGDYCRWSPPRHLHWRMPKPVLWSGRPALSFNSPRLNAQWSPVLGADRHAVCVTHGPTAQCEPDNLLKQTPWSRSSAYDDPVYQLNPSDVRQYAGQTTYWSAAACRDTVRGLMCEWSWPQPLAISPDVAEIVISAHRGASGHLIDRPVSAEIDDAVYVGGAAGGATTESHSAPERSLPPPRHPSTPAH